MDCKVFGANNVEIVTKTRTEHMSAEDKQRAKVKKEIPDFIESYNCFYRQTKIHSYHSLVLKKLKRTHQLHHQNQVPVRLLPQSANRPLQNIYLRPIPHSDQRKNVTSHKSSEHTFGCARSTPSLCRSR